MLLLLVPLAHASPVALLVLAVSNCIKDDGTFYAVLKDVEVEF